MVKGLEKNQFFDINKFPAKEGILLFPISMSKISNAQNAPNCFKYMEYLANKVSKPVVGLNFIYGDYLYFNSDEKASNLKNKYLALDISHKNEFKKFLNKNQWYVPKSFSFTTWNQILLEYEGDFLNRLSKLKEIYHKDKKFQKYMLDDLKSMGLKKLDENQLNFFLEEILFFYLVAKGQFKLPNEFIQGHEKWILSCYPGKPLKSEIYVFQKNFFKLSNPKNVFENCYYDLEGKKLYDYSRVDLETIKL